jgi:hypothetical protein
MSENPYRSAFDQPPPRPRVTTRPRAECGRGHDAVARCAVAHISIFGPSWDHGVAAGPHWMRNSYASRPLIGACSCCTCSPVTNGLPRTLAQESLWVAATSAAKARPNGPTMVV